MTISTMEPCNPLVGLLKAHFFTRTDKVAAKMPWGKPHPIEGGDNLDGLLLAHVLGDAAPRSKARYGNRKGSVKVEAGHYRIGSYTPDEKGLTRWLCLDFDGGAEHTDSLADPEAAVLSTLRACHALGLPVYLERSGGGQGWHVWVFFEQPVTAKEARQLGFAIAPKDAPLVAGSCADARRSCGIEVFPKQDKIKKKPGYGNLVWLPWWSGAPLGANTFCREEGGKLVPFVPEAFATVTPERLAEVIASLAGQADGQTATPESASRNDLTVSVSLDEESEAVRAYLAAVESDGTTPNPSSTAWTAWREKALAALPIEAVYGPWLTGAKSGESWLECRDPSSPSGDQNPSSGVADGTGEAPRGTFHSFRTGENTSVFDFMVRHGIASSFGEALKKVAEVSGVALPAKEKSIVGDNHANAAPTVPPPLKLSRKLLPQIVVNNRQFRDVSVDAWSALHAGNKQPSLFVRMGGLVQVSENVVEDKRIRQIESLSEMALYDRLARAADWVRESEDAITSVAPPKDIARVMAAVPDAQLPPLSALAEGPVFARDGSLIATPGYHREAALWLDLPEGFALGEVPEVPTPEEVTHARALLLDELFVDFPFVAASDKAHAIAALILPFVRRLISGRTPIHLIEAPTEGSGKGYICHAISIIATGQTQGARTLSQDDDEARKMITSELSTGRSIILLDNADDKRPLNSPSLASVITADTWTDRQLGQSRMLTMPNNAVWLLTGNNPKLSMELARRCVRIRIEPPEERPHLRRAFKHDPFLDWVREHRAELVRAVLILVRHWIACGKPLSAHRLGSFERWAQIMGSILDLAGIPGFLENLETLYEVADMEGEAWREFITRWWQEHGELQKRVADLNDLCDAHDLLLSVRGDGSTKSRQTRLGYALMSKRDRVYCGLRIHRVGRSGKDCTVRYCLLSPRKNLASLNPQGDFFKRTGTSTNSRNLKNEVPAQGSCPQGPETASVFDQAGTCKNLLATSACRDDEAVEAPIIGTRASARAQELTRNWRAGEKAPGGSCQNAESSATTEYNCELSTGTYPGEVPAPSTTTDAPPWDHLPGEPGDIDLADFDDEEVEQ